MSDEVPVGWHAGRLKELCEPVERRLGASEKSTVLSVTKRGVIPQSDTYDKQITSEDISRYRVIEPGEFGLAPMALYYGAVGRYHGHAPGIISPAYNVFRHKDDADPKFLEALIRMPRMIARYEALSQGGNLDGKRKLTPYEAFETVKVSVPPLAEQRAIINVLGTVEEAIARTEVCLAQIHETAGAISEAVFHGIEPSSGAKSQKEWTASCLGAEMSSIQVGIVIKPASYYVADGGVPALRLELTPFCRTGGGWV